MDRLILADVRDGLTQLEESSVDAIVCDPPYEISFMGKGWDGTGIANNVEMWREALRVLKPGGHLLAFSGSRTYHRMVCAIEDAGFEVRDQIMWLYGSGFPKSLNVAKAVDATTLTGKSDYSAMADIEDGKGGALGKSDDSFIAYGEEGSRQGKLRHGARREKSESITDAARQWDGWGTALKPAHEPICVARKPLIGTVAANVLEHGTGALNIDGCRVGSMTRTNASKPRADRNGFVDGFVGGTESVTYDHGRWPANVIHDGSPEVLEAFPDAKGQQGALRGTEPSAKTAAVYGEFAGRTPSAPRVETDSSAARFFYCAKASKKDRGDGNVHPTVKPTELMAYLVRLVTPPGGVVLDPFMGSGSTGKACAREGFDFIGIDMTPEYVEIARCRIASERERIAAECMAMEVQVVVQDELFCA
jgi:DNA modification methylase